MRDCRRRCDFTTLSSHAARERSTMRPLRRCRGDNMKYAVLAFALLMVGCAGTPPQHFTGKDALYQELGRSEGITKVVDLFFQRLNADARINTLFAKVDH